MTPRQFYATNARDLLETRQHGFAPQGPVHVAMDGGQFSGTAIYLRPDMPVDRMDWRMLVNLEVWLWASPSVPVGRVIETASRIAHARPKDLRLHFDDGAKVHQLEIGFGEHEPPVFEFPAVHKFFWNPLNLSWTAIGRELQKALKTKHKTWSTL